ncbi:MAG: Aklanonic acid methyltransferase DauC [Alphaproteobacteria bacterium MarineAlpha11_Bin1]|nr:MAG: Aklanonic acid methyltransferase DauC [Alphaproteobacteria bacterium MarineAlpha11_Bin1]|tara:strand:+ start:11206 stop:12054 length:849 start_codon:yes stop_codon:yes gene_type:complete
MTEENTGQIEFWNSDHGLAWARYADTVDIMFSSITEAVLEAAQIRAGNRVLDLGCGNGGTTLALADLVTNTGMVMGIDVSRPMIQRAQERLDTVDLSNVSLVLGDAAVYPFADRSFDKLVSRLGAMFFSNPAAVFARLGPTLDKGGRLALGVWRHPRENLWAMEPVAAAKPFLEMPPRPGQEEAGPFSFGDPARVRRVLSGSGWQNIELTPLDFQVPLGRTLEDAYAFVTEMGPLSAPLGKASYDQRLRAINAVNRVLEENTGDDGVVRLAGACWIVTAVVG